MRRVLRQLVGNPCTAEKNSSGLRPVVTGVEKLALEPTIARNHAMQEADLTIHEAEDVVHQAEVSPQSSPAQSRDIVVQEVPQRPGVLGVQLPHLRVERREAALADL